jgi:hypothetical protein
MSRNLYIYIDISYPFPGICFFSPPFCSCLFSCSILFSPCYSLLLFPFFVLFTHGWRKRKGSYIEERGPTYAARSLPQYNSAFATRVLQSTCVCVKGERACARIFKLFRTPGINSTQDWDFFGFDFEIFIISLLVMSKYSDFTKKIFWSGH